MESALNRSNESAKVLLTSLSLDSDGRLNIDLPCRACGYNLRTLRPEGICPECTCAVEQSLRADSLALADTRWLRAVRSGLVLILIWYLLAAGADFVYSRLFYSQYFDLVYFQAYTTIRFAVALVGFWGIRKVTRAQPGHREDCLERRWRLFSRTAGLAFCASISLDSLFRWMDWINIDLPTLRFFYWWYLNPAESPTFFACAITLCFHLRNIDERQYDRRTWIFRVHPMVLLAAALPAMGALGTYHLLDLPSADNWCIRTLGAPALKVRQFLSWSWLVTGINLAFQAILIQSLVSVVRMCMGIGRILSVRADSVLGRAVASAA